MPSDLNAKDAEVTIRSALSEAAAMLSAAGCDSADTDAALLLAYVLACDPLTVRLRARESLSRADASRFRAVVQRRAQREPLQYIVGHAPFIDLDMAVGLGVFIPRPETELLAVWALQHLQQCGAHPVAVDLCTGSGALACYLGAHCPGARVVGVEKYDESARWAQRNFDRYIPDAELVYGDATCMDVCHDPVCAQIVGTADVVVSNPPYVPDTHAVSPEVAYDPVSAVFAGDDGLRVIEPMLDVIAALARSGAVIGIEHDESHAEDVSVLCDAHGAFTSIEIMHDLTGRERFTLAVRV